MTSLVGRQFRAYKVLSFVDAGGMGEVYRARDTKLGRDVAVKVLPPALATDQDRLHRFEREARVLAALNHPHIAAIYGLEEFDGNATLILEWVDGPTLAERLAKGPLPEREALGIAREIADALTAAHRKEIIHRDLKPANVKFTETGAAKVLDFGLAKSGAASPSIDNSELSTLTKASTVEGVIMGTACYMSPEQARGKPVDVRTDIWAFGCVLFEMLGARRAFEGETFSDTIARILERPPDWSLLPPSTSNELRDLLGRCLEKEPTARLGSLAEARTRIEEILASAPRRRVVQWPRPKTVATWMSLAVILAAGVFGYRRMADREAAMPRLTNPVQVTSAVGVEDYPTWSPDGRTIAYESNESGNWDIWVTQAGGGQAVNRTADNKGDDRYPSWSPDGLQIAFWSARDGGGYYVMPSLGGTAQQISASPGESHYHSPPAWSADGKQVAVTLYKSVEKRFDLFVRIVSIANRDVRDMPLPGTQEGRGDLSWSPNGRFLAYLDIASQSSETSQLRILDLADGRSTEVTDQRMNTRGPSWSADGRYIYFVSNRGHTSDLWRQRINDDGKPTGNAMQATTAVDIRHAAFSKDGRKLVYSKGRWISNLWRVMILANRAATWADAEQLTFDQAFTEFVDVSPDGKQIAFSSDRAGNQDIWSVPIGGGPAVQLTADPAPEWGPSWSPDGREIAFYAYRTGDREIFKMPSTGGAATQLTHTIGLDAGPDWSPDGREIIFRSQRKGNSDIWAIPSNGGEARQITSGSAPDICSLWSPDGKWIAFASLRSGEFRVWRVAANGGEPEMLSRGPGGCPQWSRDGRQIFFGGMGNRAGNFWAYSLADRIERPITNFNGRRGELILQSPSTDSKYLYFQWRDDLGDVWVMDVAN